MSPAILCVPSDLLTKANCPGMSYGSLLGATVAAMFPDRMDRLVLDGVVNAQNYYHHQGIDIDQFLTADSGFRAILAACIEAGPEKCALASLNSNAADLEATLIGMADKYGKNPVAVGGTVINSRMVTELLFIVIKYTSGIATAAEHLTNLVTGTNLTEVVAYYDKLSSGVAIKNDSSMGIKCSDTFPRADSIEDIIPDVEHMLQSSELFAPLLAGIAAQCANWPWAAKERYGGPWVGIKTKNPVLWFGNTYDPATPLASAKNMSAGFEGSVVVEQRGFGVSFLFCSVIDEAWWLTLMVIACYAFPTFQLHCQDHVGLLQPWNLAGRWYSLRGQRPALLRLQRGGVGGWGVVAVLFSGL